MTVCPSWNSCQRAHMGARECRNKSCARDAALEDHEKRPEQHLENSSLRAPDYSAERPHDPTQFLIKQASNDWCATPGMLYSTTRVPSYTVLRTARTEQHRTSGRSTTPQVALGQLAQEAAVQRLRGLPPSHRGASPVQTRCRPRREKRRRRTEQPAAARGAVA